MEKLDYEIIKNQFNKKIFENSKTDLLEKLSKYPSRYVGIFRPTKPFTKIIQNITQSHEIKFGDAFEVLIRQSFEYYNYESILRNHRLDNNDAVSFDQLFSFNGRTIFIEQKIRDDHDSTKKRGQIDNFEKKLNFLISKNYSNICSYFYFIDPSLSKNKNYYLSEIEKLKSFYNTEIHLVYGQELFEKEKFDGFWEEEIIYFLEKWKKDLPDLPEINFDLDSKETFEEIKNLSPQVFRCLLDNEDVVNIIFPIIFPKNETLLLLKEHFYFLSKKGDVKSRLYEKLYEKIFNILP
jgi:hypothetical protein